MTKPGPHFVNEGHLGGYIKRTPGFPHGDWWTWCPKLWDWMAEVFKPMTAIDVGCGEGHAVRYFLDHCCIDAIGIDGLATAREAAIIPASRFIVHDFTSLVAPVVPMVDLVWSCEFVEHVEERYIDNFLAVFAHAKRAVFMTHAEPGQAGHHHVNCQPAEYWIEHMAEWDFRFEEKLTAAARILAPYTHFQRGGLIFVPR